MRQRRVALRFLDALRGEDRRFGRLVESLRLFAGLSQAQLARAAGIGRARLCDIEKGRRAVPFPLGARLADALGYDQRVLLAFLVEEDLARAGFSYVVNLTHRAPRTAR